MRYVLICSVALGAILLFLLAAASGNTALFSRHYALLLGLNAALAAALLALISYQLWVLTAKLRSRVFGSRLTLRFLLMFLPMVIVPGGLVYVVSLQFMAKSIESWFDVRVDNALEGGLNLGRTALDLLLTELTAKAQRMALELADKTAAQQVVLLDRLREQAGVEDALLLSSGGNVIASASRGVGKLLPDLPNAGIQRQTRQSRVYSALEGAPDKRLSLRVLVPVAALSITEDERLLQLLQPVPPTLARDAEAVQEVYRDYKELSLSRQGLKEIYILTLTLTLLLTLFSATALAFLLSARLSEPLALLAAGTQAVARGDYSRRAQVTSTDELGILTQSFNSMTEQLDDARSVAESHRAELETAKAYLENILANLSAGVLVFDEQLRLGTVNHGAGAILREQFDGLRGRTLGDWTRLQPLALAIVEGFKQHGAQTWQRQLELAERMLLVRGSVLPHASGGGYVVVFDDVTKLVQAQRATAWGEVARRLAHEIKNPLTPIQLSAERLQAKLANKLAPEDAAALNRATETIINQVTAMKGMVDDFGEYARTPAPNLQPLDLNALVREVLGLYEHAGALVQPTLQAGLPRVTGDATQLRQVIHNLLQNAQDALAGSAGPRIEVETERAGNFACLRISDNGCGFPEAIMTRVFDPYVTTKPRGTGLGLAIVKKIIDEHNGAVSVENLPGRGASVSITLPLQQESARGSLMAQILVVDDEIGIRELLSEILADEGHTAQLAEDAAHARALRNAERPDLVLLDIWMPDTDGITLLKEWAANGQLTMPVVMMSGHGTIETAVEATRIGAIDFLEKPIALQKLLATVKRALRSGGGQAQAGLTLLSLGRSAQLVDLRKRLAQIATLSVPVLLRGEPGVMPELFARYMHQPNTPWIVADAAMIDAPHDLLELAASGLIFIEELAALGRAQQKNLAFILARQEVAKLRIVSFSAEEPARLVAELGFDAALLARLSELSLALPALREHAEDIPDIAGMLLAQLVEAKRCPPRHFSTAALNALRQFHWPRNLEDLQGAVKNLALTALEEEIGAADVERVSVQFHPASSTQLPLPIELPLREAREAFERAYFEQLLGREGGSIARVAEKSGLERTHLYRKLKALGITVGKKDE